MGVALIKTPHVCTKFSNEKKKKKKVSVVGGGRV